MSLHPDRSTASDSTPDSCPVTVLHLTGDLMLASRVRQFCAQRQWPYKILSRLSDWQPQSQSGSILIVDLQSPGWDPESFRQLNDHGSHQNVVVAYAQHVETDRLAAAADAGIEHVLTRGQFDSQFPRLLTELG